MNLLTTEETLPPMFPITILRGDRVVIKSLERKKRQRRDPSSPKKKCGKPKIACEECTRNHKKCSGIHNMTREDLTIQEIEVACILTQWRMKAKPYLLNGMVIGERFFEEQRMKRLRMK